jgi:hypothetical protein
LVFYVVFVVFDFGVVKLLVRVLGLLSLVILDFVFVLEQQPWRKLVWLEKVVLWVVPNEKLRRYFK